MEALIADDKSTEFTHSRRRYITCLYINPYPAKLIYLNFQPLVVVSRYRDPHLQMVENYSYLFNFRSNINKSMLTFK